MLEIKLEDDEVNFLMDFVKKEYKRVRELTRISLHTSKPAKREH